MSNQKKRLLSILMDSPLYLTLPLRERHSLLARMVESYPFLVKADGDDAEGSEASWAVAEPAV